MTYEDEAEVQRVSVGTKVLILGFAILAVLGSFWSIVWFIRAYVEPPRVGMPLALASSKSRPVPAPAAAPEPSSSENAKPEAEAAPAEPPRAEAAPPAPPAQAAAPEPASSAQSPASGAVADRWLPMNQMMAAAPAAPPPPAALSETSAVPAAPGPATTAPAALATGTPENDPPIEEVAEGNVPAIEGPAPLPRRRPTQTASVKRNDPPLPRPRPDGSAPPSVWTPVGTTDDRYPGQ